MASKTYTVTGMTCEHCVASVSEEVEVVPGVTAIDIDLQTGRMTLGTDGHVDDAAVKAAVEEAGYELA